MVTDLEALGQFPDSDGIPSREPLDSQQRLVLLWRQSHVLGGVLAEAEKDAERVPKRGQDLILSTSDTAWSRGHKSDFTKDARADRE